MTTNLNGDIVPDDDIMSDDDLHRQLFGDAEYTGDVVLDAEEAEQLVIENRQKQLAEIGEQMDEVGGVNKTIAMEMEAIVPGCISNQRSLASYTNDYSHTNYRSTRLTFEALHVVAVAAIAVGVGVMLAAFIGWLISTFSDDDGKGGHEARGKKVDDKLKEVGEAQETMEGSFKEAVSKAKTSQGELKEKMLSTVPKEQRKVIGDNYDKYLRNVLFKQHLRASYTPFVHEMINGKGNEHLKFLDELVKKLPGYIKDIQTKQHELLELTKEGNTDSVSPENYYIRVEVGGKKGQEATSFLDQRLDWYSKNTVKGDDQWYEAAEIKTGRAIGSAKFGVEMFDSLHNHIPVWEAVNKEMQGSKGNLEKAKIPKERQQAIAQAWKNMKYGQQEVFKMYRIANMCMTNVGRFSNDLTKAVEDQRQWVLKLCGIGKTSTNEEDRKFWENAETELRSKESVLSKWSGTLFGKKGKTPEGGNPKPEEKPKE